MIEPATPVDEVLRLETLRKLDILDSAPEDRFDRITRLAKRLFDVDIALVSLVDSDRQWFKSRQGLDACETGRDISFCGHAILADEILVVNDAHIDERFSDNPLVTDEPSIRFYAGYPLRAPTGHKVGTLCIIDRQPRELDEEGRNTLRELGEMVEQQLAISMLLNSDPVTGLLNRSGFCQVVAHVAAVCERSKSPASLMLVTVPNLKLISRAHGLDGCDRALTEIAQMLRATVRESDVVARIDDDTFAVFLTGTDEESRRTTQSPLQARIEERNSAPNVVYEMEVRMYSVRYDTERHERIDMLIDDALQKRESDAIYPASMAKRSR